MRTPSLILTHAVKYCHARQVLEASAFRYDAAASYHLASMTLRDVRELVRRDGRPRAARKGKAR